MDYDRTFKPQMNRLAAAYRLEIPAPTMAAYWTVFAASDDARFATACGEALDSERAFPSPAALRRIMRTAAEVGRRGAAPGMPLLAGPKLTAADLDGTCRPRPAVHRIGSPAHTGFLANSAALIAIMERRLSERMAALNAHPHDADLERRVDLLGAALSHQYQWQEHFARTGESLLWEVPA